MTIMDYDPHRKLWGFFVIITNGDMFSYYFGIKKSPAFHRLMIEGRGIRYNRAKNWNWLISFCKTQPLRTSLRTPTVRKTPNPHAC